MTLDFERPSEVRKAIESQEVFPRGLPADNSFPTWGIFQAGIAATIIGLVDRLDPRVMRQGLSTEERTHFKIALEQLRHAYSAWSRGDRQKNLSSDCVGVLHRLLGKCPDDASSTIVAALPFITDDWLREDIARDIESLKRHLANDEWKAATVIGGSVVEALLLWQVEARRSDAEKFGATRWKDKSGAPVPIEDWSLERLLQCSVALGIISDKEESACKLAQHYRNSIHPSVARRRAEPANEGTAYSAVAAVKLLLAKWA
jgi:hypothetical protein